MEMIMENYSHILIFKTNIKTADDKFRISEMLSYTAGINDWSVDCDDIDCVMRIVSYTLNSAQIIELINKMGYQCQELE